ncbi:MAG TPA: hypothetical protein VGC76_09635 [Pyrinomonadaceae bacterium]|jgi:hypothetical protein
MSDLAEFDTFATQFGNSLLKEGETGDSNWFGRLVRFYQGSQFRFINFFGTNYTESEFREALETDAIIVKAFDVSNISYVVNPSDPLYADVTADVHVEAIIDGEEKINDFTITHKIKQTWQTYETELLPL